MAHFVIQTRQKTDTLFPVPVTPATVALPLGPSTPPKAPNPSAAPQGPKPLAGNASLGFGPVEVDGYAEIGVLVIADQAFTVTFFEGILPAGPFLLTQTFVAVASGALFVVAQRFAPTGLFMKMTIANNSATPESILSLLVQGIPLP